MPEISDIPPVIASLKFPLDNLKFPVNPAAMEKQLAHHLLVISSAFTAITARAMSTVSERAAGDWRFFEKLRNGGGFTVRTYDRALQWFSDNWPDGAAWPADVPRPPPSADDSFRSDARPASAPAAPGDPNPALGAAPSQQQVTS